MKLFSTLFLVLFLCFTAQVNAQVVNIPDQDFLDALIDNGYDTNNDGQIQVSEAEAVTYFNTSNKSFASMQGIEAFANMRSFSCSRNNSIASIDLSNFTELTSVSISVCNNLQNVSIADIGLTYINITDNSNLTTVSISEVGEANITLDQLNSLVSLDINQSTSLSSLSLRALNSLTNYNFSNIEEINHLGFLNNNVITNLDLSTVNKLNQLSVHSCNSISAVDISMFPGLKKLSLINTASVSNVIFGSNPSLSVLDVQNSPSLQNLDLGGLNELQELKFIQNNTLSNVDLTGLSSIQKITIDKCPIMTSIDLTPLSTLNNLVVKNCASVESISFGSSNSSILSSEIQYCSVLGQLDLSTLTGLENLTITHCALLTNVDFSNLANLKTLNLGTNKLSNLLLEDLNSLDYIRIYQENSLQIVTLNNLKTLRELSIERVSILKDLNMDGLNSLSRITLNTNAIEELRLNDFPLLSYIALNDGKDLRLIELSNLPSADNIRIYNNDKLKSLRIEDLNSLKTLYISNRNLQTLVLNNLNSLQSLTLEQINLPTLTVDAYPSLQTLTVNGSSQMKTLNITNLSSLFSIGIDNLDSLETLNMDKLNSLEWFNIYSCELLEDLNLSGLRLLSDLDLSYLPSLKYMNVVDIPTSCSFNIYGCPNIEWICASPNQLSWLEARIDLDGIVLDPTCSFTGYDVFKKLVVDVKYAEDSSCQNATKIIEDLAFDVSSFDQALDFYIRPTVNDTGAYQFKLPPNSFNIVPRIENLNGFKFFPNALDVVIDEAIEEQTASLCVTATKDTLTEISIHVLPLELGRPGFETKHRVRIANLGNYPTSGQFVYLFDNEVIDFVSSTLPLQEQDGILTGDFDKIKPFESFEFDLTLKLNSPMDNPPLNGGESLLYTATAEPTNPKGIKKGIRVHQDVVNSFDPNDKVCLQGKYLLDSMIGDYVTYRIRFENTGNGEAINVRVIDEIDEDIFDISTLRVIETSHEVYVQVKDNEIGFIFDGINLPFQDSINDGYIFFELKTWDDLDIDTELKNTADIFFDFNFPVRTNTSKITVATDMDGDGFVHIEDCDDSNPNIYPGATEILDNGIDEDCDGEDQLSATNELEKGIVNISPNPFSEEIIIKVKEIVNYEVRVFDIMGSVLLTSKNIKKMNLEHLSKGTYFVKVIDAQSQKTSTHKIVKVK